MWNTNMPTKSLIGVRKKGDPLSFSRQSNLRKWKQPETHSDLSWEKISYPTNAPQQRDSKNPFIGMFIIPVHAGIPSKLQGIESEKWLHDRVHLRRIQCAGFRWNVFLHPMDDQFYLEVIPEEEMNPLPPGIQASYVLSTNVVGRNQPVEANNWSLSFTTQQTKFAVCSRDTVRDPDVYFEAND